MTQFPAVDPIPLPAPIWLFKLLHDVTLALHLSAVELLLGGIILGLTLLTLGRAKGSSEYQQAAGVLAHRLPTVMAFVINLGVPPLLFAQVLYGRALYTSSVLIGAYWISVIFLLMASYYGLYFSAKRAEHQKPWTATGFASLLLVLTIAFIYSNNMTLMLRPQSWAGMYQHSPGGLQWNTADPTMFPRWLFFVVGSLPAAGVASMLLGKRPHLEDSAKQVLWRIGAVAAVVGIVVQAGLAQVAISAQPASVVSTVMQNPFYVLFAYGWMATAVLVLLAAGAAVFSRTSLPIAIAAALAVFLNIASTVMVRDGIRDVTLRMVGFEVWDRQVVTNWSVVGLFLFLFVAALGVIGYLIVIAAKARPAKESYA